MSSTNEGGTKKTSRTDADRAEPSDSVQRNAALRNHRIQFEDADNPNAERVQTARKNDIIFGRGIGLQRHPGNQRMREIVDRYKEQYQSVERARKRDVVEAAYNEIVEGGARFLARLPDEDTFFVVDISTALLKVSNTLRCKKSLNRAVTTETDREHLRDPSDGNDQKEARAQSALHVDNSTPYAVGRTGIPSIESLLLRRDQTLPLGMPVSSGLGLGHASLPLNLGARPVSEAMEAQRLAVAHRYSTIAGIPGMPLGLTNASVLPSSIAYYDIVRRDQLIREILLLQQIGNAQRLNAGSLPRTISPQNIIGTSSSARRHRNPNELPPNNHRHHNEPRGDGL
jgi:hypothetical protein